MLAALPAKPPLPPIAVCVRLSVPLVAPPIASFTPPLLVRLTDAPPPGGGPKDCEDPPPGGVPARGTVPPVADLQKPAGPRPPLDRVAEPPPPPWPPDWPPAPPVAMAVIVTWSRAIPLA